MPQVINTNVGSLNAQRQLNMSQKSQQTSMERLSSGLRINSAKDDAAGLAISTKFDSQVRGLEQANRNANDGISVAQTAEGSMQEMTSILQRMRELGLQSANDSNSSEERGFIQQEMDQMTEELDRISENTEFNGAKLLNSEQTKSFQIGANSGQTIDIDLKDVSSKALGLTNTDAKGDLNGGRVSGDAIGAGDVNLNGVALGPVAQIDGETVDAIQVAEDINAKSAETGVTADAYNSVKGSDNATGVVTGLTLEIGDNAAVEINANSAEELVTKINEKVAGVKAEINDEGGIVLSNDSGEDIKIGTATGGDISGLGIANSDNKGYVSLTSQDGSDIKITAGASGSVADAQSLGFNVSDGADKLTGTVVTETAYNEAAAKDNPIIINGQKIDAAIGGGDSAAEKAAAINAKSADSGVTAKVVDGTKELTLDNVTASKNFEINGHTISSGADNAALMANINGDAALQGLGISAAMNDAGDKVILSSKGTDLQIDGDGTDEDAISIGGANVAKDDTNAFEAKSIELTSKDGKDITVKGNAGSLASFGLKEQGGADTQVQSGLDVTSVSGSNDAIDRIDAALGKISEARADLGAKQNRLNSTINNNANVQQNLSAANSRIKDADFAKESSNLSRTQVLQQAGTSMLAQANQSTQSVLSLLG